MEDGEIDIKVETDYIDFEMTIDLYSRKYTDISVDIKYDGEYKDSFDNSIANFNKSFSTEFPTSQSFDEVFNSIGNQNQNNIAPIQAGISQSQFIGLDAINAQKIDNLSPTAKMANDIGKGFSKGLNELIQANFNPEKEYKYEKKFGDVIFREGDKVMQIKNNYDIEFKKDDGTYRDL